MPCLSGCWLPRRTKCYVGLAGVRSHSAYQGLLSQSICSRSYLPMPARAVCCDSYCFQCISPSSSSWEMSFRGSFLLELKSPSELCWVGPLPSDANRLTSGMILGFWNSCRSKLGWPTFDLLEDGLDGKAGKKGKLFSYSWSSSANSDCGRQAEWGLKPAFKEIFSKEMSFFSEPRTNCIYYLLAWWLQSWTFPLNLAQKLKHLEFSELCFVTAWSLSGSWGHFLLRCLDHSLPFEFKSSWSRKLPWSEYRRRSTE